MRLIKRKGATTRRVVTPPQKEGEEVEDESRGRAARPSQTYEDVIVALRQQLDAAKKTIEQLAAQLKAENDLAEAQAAIMEEYKETQETLNRFTTVLEKIYQKKVDTYESTVRMLNMEVETLTKERDLLRNAMGRIREIKVGAG